MAWRRKINTSKPNTGFKELKLLWLVRIHRPRRAARDAIFLAESCMKDEIEKKLFAERDNLVNEALG